MLLDAGGSPNSRDGWYTTTSLHYAASNRCSSTVELLLKYGADPTIEDRDGRNVLEFAIGPYSIEERQTLDPLTAVKISDPQASQTYYTCALFQAARLGFREYLLLVLRNANINAVEVASGDTALIAAIRNEKLPVARLLVRRGARQDVKDSAGRSALQLAAPSSMHLLVQDLVKAKDSTGVDDPDENGFTTLMIAARARNHQTIRTLLNLGADKQAMNIFGETATDIAEELGDDKLVELLGGHV